jgi:protein TonB
VFTTPVAKKRAVGAYSVALAFHVFVLIAIAYALRPDRVRVGAAGPVQHGIAAFQVQGSVGTAGMSTPAVKPAQPARTPAKMQTTKPSPADAEAPGSGQAAAAGGSQAGVAGGPVRLGSGAGLELLKKVKPAYPPVMQAARVEGTVVLDAVIHRDGSIGDVTVLKSSVPAFERAAIDAVKQWRYTPLPYEGIVTVTVNFTLH